MTRDELLDVLAGRVDGVRRAHPVRVAIDGVDAAGKTTLADELAEVLEGRGRDVIRASVDDFHNPASVRLQRGLESAEGYYRDSFNHSSLIEDLLAPLGPGGSGRFRRAVFDYRSDAPIDAPSESAARDAVLLFDGVFLHRLELRAFWDYSIFVRAGFDVTVARAERRDLELFGSVEGVRSRYEQRYVPGQRLYLTEVQPDRYASIVVDNDDPLSPRIVSAR